MPIWANHTVDAQGASPSAYGTYPVTFQKDFTAYSGRLLSLAEFFAANRAGFAEEEPLNDPFKQLAAVYACVLARSRPLAMCPLKLYTTKMVDGETVYEEVQNHPLIEILYNPNPYMSRYQLIEAWETSTCISGEQFFYLERRNFTDIPKSIWHLPASTMTPVKDSKGLPKAWIYRPGGKNSEVRFELWQILHEKLWDPANPIRGLSPLVAANIVTKQEWAALQFNYFFLLRGCEPGGRYEMEGIPSMDQITMLEREHRDKYEGPSNVGKTMIDWGGTKFKPYQIPQKDMQFQAAREMNLRDIMMALGVMRINLGLDEMNFAQAQEMKRMFWHNTLIPRVRAIEDALYHTLTKHIDGGKYEFLFDLNAVEALRENVTDKAETAVKLVQGGVPWNEVNRLLDLGLEEFEGWDVSYSLRGGSVNPTPPTKAMEDATKAAPEGEQIVFEEIDPEDIEYNQKWDRDVLRPREKAFQGKMSRFFSDHRNEVLSKFSNATGWDGKSLPPFAWRGEMIEYGMEVPDVAEYKDDLASPRASLNVDSLLPKEDEMQEKLAKYTTPIYEEALLAGAEARALGLGTEQQIAQITEDLAKWIESQCVKRHMKQVNETIRDAIRESLKEGIKNQETLAELAGRIKHIHQGAKNRTLTIARTEVGRAANFGAYSESEESGVVEGHTWITGGFNIRDSHSAIHGQYRKIGARFSNGLLYPGDPDGGASDVCNCKCNLRERLSK